MPTTVDPEAAQETLDIFQKTLEEFSWQTAAVLVCLLVAAIVAMGVDNSKIVEFFSPHVAEVADTGSLDEAIAACRRLAKPGQTVLLSPCCASFDLFKSYEDRGRRFKDAVNALKNSH